MTIFLRFSFSFLFFIIYAAIVINDGLFLHYHDGTQNVLSFVQAVPLSKQKTVLENEHISEDSEQSNGKIAPLKLKVKKLSQENEDILKNIQQFHDSPSTMKKIDAKIDANSYKDEEDKEDKEDKEDDQVQLKKKQKKKSHIKKHIGKNINEESSADRDNTDSFLQMQKTNSDSIVATSNKKKKTVPKKSKSLKKKDDLDESNDIDISDFVNMLGEINKDEDTVNDDIKQGKKKKAKKVTVKDENHEAYNEAENTTSIFNENEPENDMYKKYRKEKKKHFSTVITEGTDYLGAGYDIIFGNPLGDPFLKVDPGYRDSIIKLTYPKSDDDYPENYKNKNPNGSYIRQEIFCIREEHQSEVHSMEEYNSEMAFDFSVGASVPLSFSFSASYGFKEASESLSNNKNSLFILRSYCNQYVASLSNYGQWKLSDQFQRAISIIPPYFNSEEHDGKICQAKDLGKHFDTEACGSSVYAWLHFFKSFGTHVSTLLHLGGKIVQTLTISNKNLKTLVEKGHHISLGGSGTVKGVTVGLDVGFQSSKSERNEISELNLDKETITIGGEPIFDPNDKKSFEKWSVAVKEYPMPIKGEYEPISKILPTNLVSAYNEAMEFYVALYGSTDNTTKSKSKVDPTTIDIKNIIQSASKNSQAAAGVGLQTATCPINTVVIGGFNYSVSEHEEELYHIDMNDCEIGKTSCTSTTNDKAVYNYVFILCSSDVVPYLTQSVTMQNATSVTMTCQNKKSTILWGFGIIYNHGKDYKVSVEPCSSGKNNCHIKANTQSAYIAGWILCGHEDFANSKISSSLARNRTLPANPNEIIHNAIDCPQETMLSLKFEFFRNIFNTNFGPCLAQLSSCPVNNVFASPKSFIRCSEGKEPNKKKKETLRNYSIYELLLY